MGRGILILSAFVKEALLRYKIKLLFFSCLNGTNQLNSMKDTTEKLLCNFRKPWNPDLAVELPQGASPKLCVSSGRGRGWREAHCPSQSLPDTPWVGVPMRLGWSWRLSNVLGCTPTLGGPSELSSLLTAKGNVSLLCLGLLQNRFYGKGTPVQKEMCPGPGLFDSGVNRQSVSFKESSPIIIPSPDL